MTTTDLLASHAPLPEGLTEESAWYALNGPHEQRVHNLRQIIRA